MPNVPAATVPDVTVPDVTVPDLPDVPTVIVLGSINEDIVVRAPRHPVPGETLLGSSVQRFPGGKGANQAVAASLAGALTLMIARVGDDISGSAMRTTLHAAKVDTTYVGPCKHDPTGTAVIVVSDAGENTIVVIAGANEKLRPVHVDDAFDAQIAKPNDVVLAQLEIPIEVVSHALQRARRMGVRTILNAAPAQQLPDALVGAVDVLIVNETELATLTGDAEWTSGIANMSDRVGTVVLTRGGEGVAVCQQREIVCVPGHEVEVVDTTGAGDAFCGAFAAAIASGLGANEAARFANGAAALACTRLGAQSGLATQRDIDAFLSSKNVES
jgi:ribokinase